MLYIFPTLTWQFGDVFLRIHLKNFLIRTLSSTSKLMRLDLRATNEGREEEIEAIDFIFRLIVVDCTRFATSNACCDRDCTCED